MQQRQLRLGDILDDYCPRERRLTNHAIVAMVGDHVRQTRCTTCDADHPYKGGKVPPRRKKTQPATAAAYEEVLASVTKKDGDLSRAALTGSARASKIQSDPPDNEERPPEDVAAPASEEGPVRRSLIRATLPRTDTLQTSRPAPEFTIRQTGRHGKFQSRPPGARFPKGRGPTNTGAGRDAGGHQGPGHGVRSGHHPQGPGMRSGPHPPRHSPQAGFRSQKKRPR